MEEEYIDYSCSTPLERLIRDMETTLRSWHVSNSDRHVAFSDSMSLKRGNGGMTRSPGRLKSSSSDSNLVLLGSLPPSPKRNMMGLRHNSDNRVALRNRGSNCSTTVLRQKKLNLSSWTFTLSLYDGPLPCQLKPLTSLPLSLQPRRPYQAMPQFNNLSAVFGIGQYLTLTSPHYSLPELQMALNIACHNCHCRIPAFALQNAKVSGYCNPGPKLGAPRATFQLEFAPVHLTSDQLSNILAAVDSGTVLHSALRHRYRWNKSKTPFDPKIPTLLFGPHPWGPTTDPLLSITISTTWDETSFPRAFPSTIPPSPPPASAPSFLLQSYWDTNLPSTSLSAFLRCTFASLIRTAILQEDVLLAHLGNRHILDRMLDQEINLSILSPITQQLVNAMTCAEMKQTLLPQEKLSQIMNNLFHPVETRFPPGLHFLSLFSAEMGKLKTPSAMAELWLEFVNALRQKWEKREMIENLMLGKKVVEKVGSNYLGCVEDDVDLSKCLLKQKLQVFNIGVEFTIASERIQDEHHAFPSDYSHTADLISIPASAAHSVPQAAETLQSSASSLCSNGDYAPILPSIGDEEEESNLLEEEEGGIEAQLSRVKSLPCFSSFIEESTTNNLKRIGSGSNLKSLKYFSARENENDSIDHNSVACSSGGSERHLTTLKTDLHFTCHNDAHSTSSDDDYFDTFDSNTNSYYLPIPELPENVPQRQKRRGARCPVQNITLAASGDQLYAPYLLRPPPVTADVILQKKMMQQHSSVQTRILLAHRDQRAKLLSDMKAFKAANPGAVFQDFTKWYGNPTNPLADIDDEFFVENPSPKKLDEASEAIQILMATKDFWIELWDEAEPQPAEEQPPLWDTAKEVEMALCYFDSMHPALLMNQILFCNFMTGYWILKESAGTEAMKVHAVRLGLNRLSQKVDQAMTLLMKDVNNLFLMEKRYEIETDGVNPLLKHVSIETLECCEAVCNMIGDVEVFLSRALTLLEKFPGEYELVQKLLRRGDGEELEVESSMGRKGILETIWERQMEEGEVEPGEENRYRPRAAVTEHILRNDDDQNPCQLTALIGDDLKGLNGLGIRGNGTLLALTKCGRD